MADVVSEPVGYVMVRDVQRVCFLAEKADMITPVEEVFGQHKLTPKHQPPGIRLEHFKMYCFSFCGRFQFLDLNAWMKVHCTLILNYFETCPGPFTLGN